MFLTSEKVSGFGQVLSAKTSKPTPKQSYRIVGFFNLKGGGEEGAFSFWVGAFPPPPFFWGGCFLPPSLLGGLSFPSSFWGGFPFLSLLGGLSFPSPFGGGGGGFPSPPLFFGSGSFPSPPFLGLPLSFWAAFPPFLSFWAAFLPLLLGGFSPLPFWAAFPKPLLGGFSEPPFWAAFSPHPFWGVFPPLPPLGERGSPPPLFFWLRRGGPRPFTGAFLPPPILLESFSPLRPGGAFSTSLLCPFFRGGGLFSPALFSGRDGGFSPFFWREKAFHLPLFFWVGGEGEGRGGGVRGERAYNPFFGRWELSTSRLAAGGGGRGRGRGVVLPLFLGGGTPLPPFFLGRRYLAPSFLLASLPPPFFGKERGRGEGLAPLLPPLFFFGEGENPPLCQSLF